MSSLLLKLFHIAVEKKKAMQISKELRIPGLIMSPTPDLSFPPGFSLGLPGLQSNAYDDPSFVQKVVDMSAPPEDVETMNRPSNPTVAFSYSILPWADGTHTKIQEWMYLFIQQYVDKDKKVVNMIPFWKLNLESYGHHYAHKNSSSKTAEQTKFDGFMKEYGEEALLAYDRMPFIFSGKEATDMEEYKRLALKPEFRLLQKYGQLNTWRHIGTCISKQEATGAFSHLNHLDDTEHITNVGVAVAGGYGPGLNIFGGRQVVGQGTKLYLIGRRATLPNGDAGPFRYEPYASREREYPPYHLTHYKDDSKRICESIVIFIGTCKSNKERDPSPNQIKLAMGYTGDAQSCYEACGFLPKIDILLA